MINRSEAPKLVAIESIQFVAPEILEITPSVPLYHMREVANETARFDLYFNAGKARGENSIASFVNGLLLTGTPSKTAIQINEEINALGGFIETGISSENAVISMYCLRENLLPLFKIVMNAIKEVAFIDSEMDDFFSDRKQKLQISREKVSYLAQSHFQERLFASEPSYATILKDSDFDAVSRENLMAFHQTYYLKGLQNVVVVGAIDTNTIQEIIAISQPFCLEKTPDYARAIQNQSGKDSIEKKDALQAAIRVGRTLFNKSHPDYLDFLVLNTVIGDYFGSRLMSNIREDKGYTYGIGSMFAELQNLGYFLIATEVGADVRELALQEIRHEIERLQTELVPSEELELVQNYMRGQLLKSADGPYAMTDLFLSVAIHGRTLDFYNDALHAINTITPERIRSLAQKYLQWDDMTIVTAG